MSYNNPHFQNPGFVHPNMQQPRGMGPVPYPQPPMYSQQGFAPQQGYPQQPVYQQQSYPPPQGFPQQQQPAVQIINTPNGPMMMDVRTGTILGPVPNQGQAQQYNPNMRLTQPMHVIQNQSDPAQNNRYGPGGNLVQTVNQSNQGNAQEYDMSSDNRYGSIQQLTSRAPQMTNVNTPATIILPGPSEPAMPKTTVKSKLSGFRFKPSYRTMPFMKKDMHEEESSTVASSLDQLITTLIDTAHAEPSDCVVWRMSGIIVNKFNDTTTIDFESDLFQTDIEAIYKVMKRLIPEVNNRSDVVYFQAYNEWLTKCVNTHLNLNITGGLKIDSFAEDFNDLMKYLLETNKDKREALIVYMHGVLDQAILDIQAIRTPGQEGESLVAKTVSIVPERLSLAYIKLLSSEIGDDGSAEGLVVANKLMASLEEQVGEPVFYMVTLDRCVYEVIHREDDSVSINCISD